MRIAIFTTLLTLIYMVSAQTSAVVSYTGSQCTTTTFQSGMMFYGKTDGSVCEKYGSSSYKFNCNSTHVNYVQYPNSNCVNQNAIKGAFLIGACVDKKRYYCSNPSLTYLPALYIKRNRFSQANCQTKTSTHIYEYLGCFVDENGNRETLACALDNQYNFYVKGNTYNANSTLCVGDSTVQEYYPTKCYSAKTGTQEVVCGNASSMIIYWSLSVLSVLFLTL
eukprot:gene2706-3902_t